MKHDTVNGICYSGFYRGKVVKHLDHGKCKIYIPEVYGISSPSSEAEINKLPDAEPASPLFGGGNSGNGCFSYPNIGAIVWCFFDNEDINYPIYFASCLGGEKAEKNYIKSRSNASETASSQVESNDAYIHSIKCGNSEINISESGVIIFICKSGNDYSKIEINGNGNVTIESSKRISKTTSTIIDKSASQIRLESPAILENGTTQITMISPSIILDAKKGAIKMHGVNTNYSVL